ncbi:BON domain-containing protein [Acidimangrovimonas pyrenivorans]|uniref:BON domain-containing protein n=1 Tax=Acidimangrovimonas pyrenivorans TaxID=2030798 RepID=A0ABV7AGA8_9RHOB
MAEENRKQAILSELRARFRSEPRLGPHFHFDSLDWDETGTLILGGEVPSVAAKKRALECAASHPAVNAILDRVHVAPATAMGDAEIRAHLREFFTREPAFAGYAIRQQASFAAPAGASPDLELVAGDPAAAPSQIDIEISAAVVTLGGRVPSLTAKRLAGVMAWWVPGVRDVVNGLEVEPEEEDSPIRIEEAVRLVLERDPFLDAGQVRVGVRRRTVHLTGAVRSAALRDMAERDAWCVFGVDDVLNEIELLR